MHEMEGGGRDKERESEREQREREREREREWKWSNYNVYAWVERQKDMYKTQKYHHVKLSLTFDPNTLILSVSMAVLAMRIRAFSSLLGWFTPTFFSNRKPVNKISDSLTAHFYHMHQFPGTYMYMYKRLRTQFVTSGACRVLVQMHGILTWFRYHDKVPI